MGRSQVTLLDLSELTSTQRVGAARPRRAAFLVAADLLALGTASATLPLEVAAVYGAGAFALLAGRGCYATRFSGLTGRSLGRVAGALVAPAIAMGIALHPAEAQSLLRSLPIVFAAVVVLRFLALKVVDALAVRGGGQPTLILGAGQTAVRIAHHLLDNPKLGLCPVGFLDRIDDPTLPLPIVGDAADLAAVAQRVGARQVIVAYGQVPEAEMVGIIRACHSLDVDVWVVPRFFELGLTGPRAVEDDLWGIPVTKAPRAALRTYQWRLKRVFDVVVSACALLLLGPLMAVLALAVKLTSPGPVFFRQQRVGQGGRIVEVLKFRSLRMNDDCDTTWNVTADDRVTAIGRLIRPTSLDETPQLLNVLRGDMSLVGPRPERPFFVAEFSTTIARYDDRHRVPVGVTGLAQVNGLRGDTSIEERARFDNAYIENWSLWGDVVILFRTVVAVVRPPRSVRIQNDRSTCAPAVPAEQIIDLRDPVESPPPAGIYVPAAE